MQSDPKKPLSKAELDRLAMFLSSEKADGALDLVETHGLLTAIVSAPGTVMPSVWQPIILGDTEFEDANHAQAVFGSIMRLFNQIVGQLADKKTKFVPLIPTPRHSSVGAEAT